jgi:DNA-binding NarL/FixJ family response regulator
MIRVLVADDHSLVRSGLAQLLGSAADVELVGQAVDGNEAVAMVDELVPDVVLMDLSMPNMDGITATRLISERHPGVRVVALTAFSERTTVLDALDAGAIGYVLKDGEMDELLRATRAAARGESPLSPAAAHVVLTARHARTAPDLTGRERDVMRLVVTGVTNREIAERLAISEKTVKTHLTRVYQRFGLRNRTDAIAWARRLGIGLADPEQPSYEVTR